jgi:HSP20 family protein
MKGGQNMGHKKKRGRDFDDDWFGFDMDDEVDRMRKRMEDLMEAFMKNREFVSERPFVYGFSMRTGPNGKPTIREFGNTAPLKAGKPGKPGRVGRPGRIGSEMPEMEPLTDIIEDDAAVSVTVEIPGVEKKDIDLDLHEKSLIISVDSEARKYHKELELPSNVHPDSAKATYKNGVLDIVLEKVKTKKGRKVSIE